MAVGTRVPRIRGSAGGEALFHPRIRGTFVPRPQNDYPRIRGRGSPVPTADPRIRGTLVPTLQND